MIQYLRTMTQDLPSTDPTRRGDRRRRSVKTFSRQNLRSPNPLVSLHRDTWKLFSWLFRTTQKNVSFLFSAFFFSATLTNSRDPPTICFFSEKHRITTFNFLTSISIVRVLVQSDSFFLGWKLIFFKNSNSQLRSEFFWKLNLVEISCVDCSNVK